MSVHIEVNYAKKLGLPGYSSHQCSVTVRTELGDISQLEKTTADLYSRLQAAVDSQIVHQGLVPSGTTALPAPARETQVRGDEQTWRCSDKQRDLILKIVAEHSLNKEAVEDLTQQRFGTGVRQLNKLQASALIDELLETHGRSGDRTRRPAYTGRDNDRRTR